MSREGSGAPSAVAQLGGTGRCKLASAPILSVLDTQTPAGRQTCASQSLSRAHWCQLWPATQDGATHAARQGARPVICLPAWGMVLQWCDGWGAWSRVQTCSALGTTPDIRAWRPETVRALYSSGVCCLGQGYSNAATVAAKPNDFVGESRCLTRPS